MGVVNNDLSPESIAEHLARVTPGPWWWGGNTKFEDVDLSTRGKYGVTSVMRVLNVARTPDDPRLEGLEDFTEEEAEELRQQFLIDEAGCPMTDRQISFAIDGCMVPAKDLAIYEVCPDATSRTDPRVYREDISGIRHPDAEFIAAAPQYVSYLLAELARAKLETEQLRAILVAGEDHSE